MVSDSCFLTSESFNEEKDLSAPFYELQSFDSIFTALQWQHIRIRLPICAHKLLHSRYMLANIVYLIYSIGILMINFHPIFNNDVESNPINNRSNPLDEIIENNLLVNRSYIILGFLHLISAILYAWAWRDRSWFDIVMIPEYLNHLAAGFYLWSAYWYGKQDTLGGSYTIAVHQIELTAAIVEVIASFGWIMSWYMSYTRTFGRGFTFDDPDTIAYLSTIISSFIYLIYNIQINLSPEDYGTNILYQYGDITYFIGACYYTLAGLRDENCFWFLPLAGQYGVAPGKVHVETKLLPQFGRKPIRITDLCRRRRSSDSNIQYQNDLNMVHPNDDVSA